LLVWTVVAVAVVNHHQIQQERDLCLDLLWTWTVGVVHSRVHHQGDLLVLNVGQQVLLVSEGRVVPCEEEDSLRTAVVALLLHTPMEEDARTHKQEDKVVVGLPCEGDS